MASPIQYYMNYTIFFRDPSEYAFAVSVAGGNLLAMAPRAAAALFGIPFPYPSGDMDAMTKGIFFYSPFSPGQQIGFPGPSGVFVDDTVLTLPLVHCQPGTPASIWPCPGDGSKDALFTWSGNIIRMGGAGASTSPPANAIAQRRWIGGREVSGQLEGGSGVSEAAICRDSSRTIDGVGLPLRGNLGIVWNQTQNQYRAITPTTGWERFYMRVRRLPTISDSGLWRNHSTPSNSVGWALKLKTTGAVNYYAINAINTETDHGALFTPVINQWYRIDILYKIVNAPTAQVTISIYINGVLFVAPVNDSGVGGGTSWTNSDLGKWNSTGAEQEFEVDLDDWVCADLPTNMNAASLTFNDANYGLDWILGSHIRYHNVVSSSQAAYSPASPTAVGVLNQGLSQITRFGPDLTSSTANAQLEGLTDALLQSQQDQLAMVLGAASALIGLYSSMATGVNGALGYRIAGAAPVTTVVDQQAALAYNTSAYLPAGQIIPAEISPFSSVYIKTNDANTVTIVEMSAVVEYLGVWGVEDDPTFQYPITRVSNLHNCRYFNTAWGYLGSQPAAPVYAIGGTYTGNGTYQEITLPAPCHFLIIRPLSGGGSGIRFFGAGLTPNFGAKERMVPNCRMFYDFTNQLFKFAVWGTGQDINQAATNFQYIAFCDPGMRFCLSTAFAHANTSSTPKANPLIVSDFLADCGFAQRQFPQSVSNIIGTYFRGPGNINNDATALDGSALVTGVMNFATGILNSFGVLHNSGSGNLQTTMMLWRMADSGGAGSGGCGGSTMVQILQYTGNGSGSNRVITLTPTSGRFPLFVLVVPQAGSASFFRDPSHSANNSSNFDSLANSTTAIVATGVDSITVNTALNTNNVVYNVFAICGDTAGQNNGTYIAGYCAGDGPYIPPSPSTGDIIVLGNGGIVLDGTTPLTVLKDISGIYTLIPGQRHDTLYDRQTGQPNVDVAIPNPKFKTGYVGG